MTEEEEEGAGGEGAGEEGVTTSATIAASRDICQLIPRYCVSSDWRAERG